MYILRIASGRDQGFCIFKQAPQTISFKVAFKVSELAVKIQDMWPHFTELNRGLKELRYLPKVTFNRPEVLSLNICSSITGT